MTYQKDLTKVVMFRLSPGLLAKLKRRYAHADGGISGALRGMVINLLKDL
jgi:hypothetical protein